MARIVRLHPGSMDRRIDRHRGDAMARGVKRGKEERRLLRRQKTKATQSTRGVCAGRSRKLDKAIVRDYMADVQGRTYDAYWNHCKTHSLPVVKVRKKRRYASVQVDMITTVGYLSVEQVDAVHALFEQHTIAPKTKGKLLWVVDAVVCWAVRIPREAADQVARELHRIAWRGPVVEEQRGPCHWEYSAG